MNGPRKSHPSIRQLGTVRECSDGTTLITGFVIGPCVQECTCHLEPVTKRMQVLQDNKELGHLGLQKWRSCYCCEPWTGPELEAMIRDLAYVASMKETT